MAISKDEYILRSLKKISKKKWEFFIISRLLHGLDDDEIEFVTQQLVRRPDGRRAHTDLYFPQFNLHLEIDEPHHEKQKDEDRRREQDIVNMTDHVVERITVPESPDLVIKTVRQEVDSFIERVINLKSEYKAKKKFIPWDFESRYSSEPVIARGYLSIEDNVVFRTQVEALRCFGFKGKGWQRGAWVVPRTQDIIWFPRLYRHGIWDNVLTADGLTIYENVTKEHYEEGIRSIEKQRESNSKYPNRKYVVFAKAKDALGFNLLRYVGTFLWNKDDSTCEMLKFDRVSSEESIHPA
ncbi:hypothetical protein SAMN05660420_01450 [Desulfuromusa kysingii]|uniref:Uncharacterized protein n=1 Tax=Desulfuromusa kysingii TaxID=37625 RepID=A0A1H3YYX4_9BACT|nr:hypothetical protein [Desulfuromusa kysingii]SEA16676.1 hypothetical protein SAMN05660420_01450 [Desulfuromusa kysingii]